MEYKKRTTGKVSHAHFRQTKKSKPVSPPRANRRTGLSSPINGGGYSPQRKSSSTCVAYKGRCNPTVTRNSLPKHNRVTVVPHIRQEIEQSAGHVSDVSADGDVLLGFTHRWPVGCQIYCVSQGQHGPSLEAMELSETQASPRLFR